MALKEMIVKGELYTIDEAIRSALKDRPALDILESLIAGMRKAGDMFQKGKYYLPELLKAAETFKEAMKILEPILGEKAQKRIGKIVLGTVRGDVHDLGKNLIGLMLDSAGIEVIDLGIDVSPEDFVAAVKKHQPQLVGMSALLTTTMLEMEKTIQALEKAGLRENLGILVGGAPVSERFAKTIGADAYAKNAKEAVDKAIALIEKIKQEQ